MKTVIALMALVLFAAPAQATRLDAFLKEARVTRVELDKKLGNESVKGGTIQYNLATKELSIQLIRAGTCGFVDCSNLEWNIRLPILSANRTGCGFKVVAELPWTPQAPAQRVELTSFADDEAGAMTCMIFVAPGEEIRVKYTTKGFSKETGISVNTESLIFATPNRRPTAR